MAHFDEFLWDDYYTAFGDYFSRGKVRKLNHPRKREKRGARQSIVLVHGLSDSPYYMSALADYFHEELGYNTYQPLLHGHGLKKPAGMEFVELEEWKRNVHFAVSRAAAKTPAHVSVGGLSTGGALSLYAALTSPKVTGDLYLFSAALELVISTIGPLDKLLQRLLASRKLSDFLDARDSDRPLVGDNPVKYDYVDKDGARELARLIRENRLLLEDYSRRKSPFPKRVFAAHSKADRTANIDGIEALRKRCKADRFTAFYIPHRDDLEVTHGGLVLKAPVLGESNALCTPANPWFDRMTRGIERFAKSSPS